MMFKNSLSTLTKSVGKQNGPSVTVVELDKDNRLEFTIDSIIQRKAMEDLLSPKQFALLNAYVDYKGEEFKKNLFNLYRKSYERIENLIHDSDFGEKQTLPYDIIDPILEMMDLKDIEDFLINVYKLKVPSDIKDSFDMQTEIDGIGTRDQTYLKYDYYGLASLVVVIKATFFVLSQYSKETNECFKSPEKDYYLLKFYRHNDKLVNSEPFDKCLRYISRLIVTQTKKEEERLIRIVSKMIEENEITMYFLSKVIFQKLTVATIVDDNHVHNIVNMNYSFIKNKIKSQGPVSQVIRPKNQITDIGSRDKESFMESYLIFTDMSDGKLVLSNYGTSTIDIILRQLSKGMLELATKDIHIGDRVITLRDIEEQCQDFNNLILTDHSMKILQIVFKGILDPRLIYRIELSSLLKLMPIGFMYMWNLGFQSLAMLLTATYHNEESDDFNLINSTTNKSRIPHAILDKLKEIFPCEKAGNKTNPDGESAVKSAIESFGNSFFSIAWVSVLDPILAKEVFNTNDGICLVKEDLKIQIANFLIEHEKYAYRKGE